MFITRANQNKIYSSFNNLFITGLLGPRRVGKSTLVKYFAMQNKHKIWIFLNMDDREERLKIENNQLATLIQEKAQQQIGKGQKIWVAIDEAQKCPALFDQVKLLYDKYKDKDVIKFILTGSGFLSLHQLSSESLAGRIELHYVREFNLNESCQLGGTHFSKNNHLFDLISANADSKEIIDYIEARAPFRPILEEKLSEQLIWGGLPEVLNFKDDKSRLSYLSHYLQTYLEKDIRAISTISDINLYHKLMEIIAEQTGSVRQDREMIEALGCTRDTLKKYRGYLFATLVYKDIYPFIGRTLKRIVKSPKGYLTNNGLISYLTGIEELTVLQKSGLIGHRFENWFLKELQVWLDRKTKRSEIYYWRTSSGREIDFVVEKKPAVFPFEITYGVRPEDKKVKNLIEFIEKQSNVPMGFYIYRGHFNIDTKNKIMFIPAWCIS